MPDLEERRKAAIEALMSGKIPHNSWGEAVASYVLDHPEEAEEMARHHYRSFLKKKSELMVWSISTGRHVNQIVLHRFIRNNTRIIKAKSESSTQIKESTPMLRATLKKV